MNLWQQLKYRWRLAGVDIAREREARSYGRTVERQILQGHNHGSWWVDRNGKIHASTDEGRYAQEQIELD